MILVTVDLLSAQTGVRETLGVVAITNDGTGTKDRRNYDVKVARKGQFDKVFEKPLRKARVENWPSESYSIWRLVLRALGKAFPEDAK